MLTIKDIVELLVQKHQLDVHSAEGFMNAVVETIHEGLKNDRVVKVKGFGTFKLTAVRERESINVNTGERVVISSHDKVSFTPDAVMRDLVNKPFAQFDTVVLADGVDFEDMPEVDAEDGDAIAETSVDPAAYVPLDMPAEEKVVTPVMVKETVSEPVPEPEIRDVREEVVDPVVEQETKEVAQIVQMPEPEPVVEPEQEEVNGGDFEPETVETEEPVDDKTVIEESVAEAPVAEAPVAEEPIVEEAVAAEPAVEEAVVSEQLVEQEQAVETNVTVNESSEEEENEEEDDDAASYYDDDETSECKKLFIMYAIIINVIVAALFFVLGYYAHSSNLLGIEHGDSPAVEASSEPAVETPAAKPADVVAPVKTDEKKVADENKEQSAVNQENDNKKDKPAEVSKPVAESKKEVKAEPKVESASKYDSDPRVRTGAYRIVGTASTVTVKAGQTVKSISKTYLGAGMECYVEAYNGGVTELKEGQKIKIPKLELKKKAKKTGK